MSNFNDERTAQAKARCDYWASIGEQTYAKAWDKCDGVNHLSDMGEFAEIGTGLLDALDAAQERNKELEALAEWLSELDDRPSDEIDLSDWDAADISKELRVAMAKARELRDVCPICDRPSANGPCKRCHADQSKWLKENQG